MFGELLMDLKTELGVMQQQTDFVHDKLNCTETKLVEAKSRLEEAETALLKLALVDAKLIMTKSKLKTAVTM
jgi:flagellin-like hook-associated protein FlgL